MSYHPTRAFILAEIGSTHDGSFGNAICLIDAASECGVDAVKFQTHVAEAETLPSAPPPAYFQEESRLEYFKRTAFTKQQWLKLKGHAEHRAVVFLSSPFSIEAVQLLEEIGVTQYKIPSGEVTNLPLLEAVAKTKKPVLLSSGMSSWSELDEAVNTIRKHHDRLTLLQCTSEYPCSYERVGLNAMLEMKERYKLPVGLSDHTLTNYAAFAAVTLGATVVEKHFTLSRRMHGSDARHSLEPPELAELVQGIRAVERILSNPVNKDDTAEKLRDLKAIFEKSIVAAIDIPAGATITPPMLTTKKPGTGLPPRALPNVIGKRAVRDIRKDTLLQRDDVMP